MTNEIYIRVKRRNQTYCLLCDKSDTIATVKERIARAIAQHDGDHKVEDPSQLRLLDAQQNVLSQDAVSLESLEQQAADEGVLLLVVFPVADGEWEAVDIAPEDMNAASAMAVDA